MDPKKEGSKIKPENSINLVIGPVTNSNHLKRDSSMKLVFEDHDISVNKQKKTNKKVFLNNSLGAIQGVDITKKPPKD